MDYTEKSKSMMASIASAVDAITQPFCCRPSYIIQASPVSDKPNKCCCELIGDIGDKYTVVYSPLHTKESTVSSKPRQEVVIQMPSLEGESQSSSSVLKPHTTVKQHQDTITSYKEDIIIVGPPSITRFPNPWILLVVDEKETAPETPTAAALEKLLQSSHTYHVHKHSTGTRHIRDDSFSLLKPVPYLPLVSK